MDCGIEKNVALSMLSALLGVVSLICLLITAPRIFYGFQVNGIFWPIQNENIIVIELVTGTFDSAGTYIQIDVENFLSSINELVWY